MTNSEPDDRGFLNQVLALVEEQTVSLEQLKQEQERCHKKISNYQQAIQWVVQISFTLIASATITAVTTAGFKK